MRHLQVFTYLEEPKYGTSGTATQEHYSGSTFAKSGGFKDSKYASKPGGYRDSQYSTPMAKDPNADHSPRKFGSGSSPSAAPPPSRSYRPAPPPYRPPAPRSPGRSFGRRRKRRRPACHAGIRTCAPKGQITSGGRTHSNS